LPDDHHGPIDLLRKRPASSPTAIERPWRRWTIRALALGLGALIGFLAPTWWVVDRYLQHEFGRLTWQIPTRVLARPLLLRVGEPLSIDSLLAELQAAGYRDDGEGRAAGSFRRDGAQFWIASRGFRDVSGAVPAQRVEVSIAGRHVARVKDAQGTALAEARLDPARIATFYGAAQEERQLVRLEEVPPLLITTLQAVEDRNFLHHAGIDWKGMLRALWVNLREGEVRQGGSTLTQQLVRSLYLTREQTVGRKLREALYAVVIELRFDKRRILEAYLNQIYLGQQGGQAVHGVAAGARFWFGRDLQQLGSAEIALLVGLIQGPSHLDPRRYPERAKARRDRVLAQMAQLELIDESERQRATATALGVSAGGSLAANRHPGFVDLMRAQLASDYPAEKLRGAGLHILTTLAPSAQAEAERAVSEQLAAIKGKPGVALEAALVLTDTASGEVIALVGGRDPRQPGFNRALDARRPVGSLLKPFVYLLALAQPGRWSLATPLEDAPITIRISGSQQWSPENSDQISHGWTSLLDSLSRSYNQSTVRLGMEVGVDRLSRLMAVLGGVEPPAHPSLLLGAVDLSPLQMTSMYQFLASAGAPQRLRSVRGVLDADGKALHRYDAAPPQAEIGDAIATRLVTLALQEAAVRGTASALGRGDLRRLAAAGKTGTSNDGRDSWFAGWTGRHLAVAWVGNDANQPTGLYGATGAMQVWSALFERLPTVALQVDPGGLEWAVVDPTGRQRTDPDCEGAREFAFVAGFAPDSHQGCTLDGFVEWLQRGRSE
jgi:penicillin-binding protein 1B